MKKHILLLGKKAVDKVTGFEGIVESVSFDLYGCIQAVLRPPMDDKGEIQDGRWFDVRRLRITEYVPVMPLPDFNKGYVADGNKGAAGKPVP